MASEADLIAAMTQRGHTEDTARAAITGRGFDDLAREYLGSGGGSGGGGGTQSYDTLAANVPSSLEFAQEVGKPINEAFKDYAMFLRGQPSPIDVYTQFEEAAGLPEKRRLASDLRGQIFDLEDTIDRVESTVEGTSRESLLTQAQKDQLVTAKKEPLIEGYEKLTRNLGRIEQGIAVSSEEVLTKTSLVQEGVDRESQLFATQLDVLTENAARIISGFDADKSTRLEIALQKIRRGEELEDRDREEAFALMTMEQEFNNQLTLLREQASIDLETYGEKKKIDQKYKTGDGDGSSLEELIEIMRGNQKGNTGTGTAQSPPMSAPAGTVVEHPQGSGIYWTSTGGGWQ